VGAGALGSLNGRHVGPRGEKGSA